jgi:acyl-CoA synthetase (AMP-forming)/AMP-acid ligase II
MLGAFPRCVLDALRSAPERPAFEYEGRPVSRAEVLELVRRLAAGLRDIGLGPGSGVAVTTAVSPAGFAVQIAAHTLGCRVVGIRPGYARPQLEHVLGAGVDAVIVDASTTTDDLLAAARPSSVLSLEDLAANREEAPLTVEARSDDIARLVYTSGSTGRPKGCVHTYRAMSAHSLWNRDRWCPSLQRLAACTERYLLFGTLSSVVVMEYLALCLLSGGTAVIPAADPRPLFPYAIERHRITAAIITVPKLYAMLDVLRRTPVDTGSLRGLMVAGSPITPDRLAEAVDRLGPVMFQGYGQSEAGSLSLLTPEEIAAGSPEVLASVGRPHDDVEVSVRDGEIYVRPYMMSGYWNDPDETAEVLVDGWLRTRDLGHLDADGFLHLVGRARDAIMVDALPQYAGPIERALARHPDVDQAYVVGAPDDRTGEAVHAYVIAVESRAPDRAALAELVRDELGEASVPATITFVSEVPVAASGKPDKRALLSLHPPAS